MTSKRKTKQLRWLVTRLMLAMTMVMPASMWAQELVMYTVYNDGTLTFMYGEKKGSGTLYDVPTYYSTAPGWSAYSSSIKTVVFDESFINAQPKSCYKWFDNCSNLTSINDIKYLNTANVENMSRMFRDCKKLTSLDLSKFDTSNVKDMSYMFNNCQNLTSLDLSNFKTANVTNMYQMFYNCSNLTSLDLLSFNTANVTTMEQMFYGCSSLTSLDLSNYDNSKVTTMSEMFSGCSGLTSLNLSNFKTANVTEMYRMFFDCSGLKDLDLSSFNTAKVTTMGQMFFGCSSLKTIYVSDDFTTDHTSSSWNMFYNCSKLVGAAKYSDSGNTGIEMANYTTGYFKTYFTLGDSKVELCGEQLTTNSLNLNLTGDNNFVAHAPFTANTATYSRDLSSSESTWFSLCLPFAYTPQNFTAYQLQSASADAVEIGEISGEIAAGMPVLFKFKDGEEKKIEISAQKAEIVKAPVDGTTVSGPGGSSLQLCGTYQNKSFSEEDGNAFILLNNKLMNPAKMLENQKVTKVSVKPFRGYMTLTASAQQASARAFSIGRGGEGDEGTTAIDLLNSVATDDAEYYDINGRRIDAPAKGVNIVRRGNKTMKLIIK